MTRRGAALVSLLTAAACSEPLPPAPEVTGPACAVSSAAEFGQEKRRVRAMAFNDVVIRLRGGHASCRAYHQASVCHFSNPRVLHVRQGREHWWFRPGPGERAALSVEKGRVRCLLQPALSVEDWAAEHMQAPRPLRRPGG